MKSGKTGAKIMYCGHAGYFIADIYAVGTANVVRPNGPVTPDNIIRRPQEATHQLTDFPSVGFWRPDLGVFVVPEEQVREIKGGAK